MRCKGTFNDVLLLREDENISRMQHSLIHFLLLHTTSHSFYRLTLLRAYLDVLGLRISS